MAEPRYTAGTSAKGDCRVVYHPGTGRAELRLSSTVLALFGEALRVRIDAETAAFGATGLVEVEDAGALDHVIGARLEAAFRAAGLSPVTETRLQARSTGVAQPAPVAYGMEAEARAAARERPRRTRLYLPGNQPDFMANAGLYGADCLLIDLEDSVAPDRKAEARILVRRTLESCRVFFAGAELALRVNPLSGPWGLADLESLVPLGPDALVLPKCESAAEVRAWEAEVARLEAASGLAPGRIGLMPLVETARGVSRAVEIAEASTRNLCLCFGGEDYRRDLGVERGPAEEEIQVARSLIALAARSAGIGAQDTVFSDLEDPLGLEASARRARSLGFSGKGLVHPSQVAPVNRVFSPSAEEVARARRLLEAAAAAAAGGQGAASFEGQMIDEPVAARARATIALAEGLERAGGKP